MPGGFAIIMAMPLVGYSARALRRAQAVAFWPYGRRLSSLFHMTSFDVQIDFRTWRVARVFQALGLAFLFVPINTAAYAFLAQGQEQRGFGTDQSLAQYRRKRGNFRGHDDARRGGRSITRPARRPRQSRQRTIARNDQRDDSPLRFAGLQRKSSGSPGIRNGFESGDAASHDARLHRQFQDAGRCGAAR